MGDRMVQRRPIEKGEWGEATTRRISMTVVLEELRGTNEKESTWSQDLYTTTRNLTLSVSNTASNIKSRDMEKFTAPSNSRSIREISSAVRRRSGPVSSINVSMGLLRIGELVKVSRIVDKRGGWQV